MRKTMKADMNTRVHQGHDPVNHPSQYTFGKFEVIEVLEDWFEHDPLLWQVGKYIARAKHKGTMAEDLKKARWYLDRRIAQADKEGLQHYD
jgi:hypothetical protein